MRRLLAVGFAPNALFVTCLWTLIPAEAFSGRARWEDVLPRTTTGPAGALGICACAALLGLLLHPYRVRAVRHGGVAWGGGRVGL